MRNTVNESVHIPDSQLQIARALALPSREAMLHRVPSVQQFWDQNKVTLADAWREWEDDAEGQLFTPDESLLDKRLRDAVEQAWNEPEKEFLVRNLWQEVAPDVFQCQFFDPERLADLRHYLNDVANANIPLRPPYGIALNRLGAMLDPRSEGYLAAPSFQAFYRTLLDTYMRPIARLLFPEIVGYDTQTFGFSIQYQAGMDTSLRLHSDASSVTLNVNLNLPGEEFEGSEVDFYDRAHRTVNRLTFTPGSAMLHLGRVAHAAQPITAGERTNFVLWLYGDQGQLPPLDAQAATMDSDQRWTVPAKHYDDYAPF